MHPLLHLAVIWAAVFVAVVATRVMTSAVIDDIGSLVAVAIVVPLTISWWRPHYLKAESTANPDVS